ncbi:MAG: GNAT family N-acetyltransferase [Pyrinomonadaceae bacterium]
MTAFDIVVRNIYGQAELRAVEALQKEVWGVHDLDVVPLTQLVAAKAAGGVLLGAFDQKTLIGFAYGFAGFEHGRMTHHSHMLAVKPAYRGNDVGYRLKLAQRDLILAQGIKEMTWTYDPLQSANAYFNFSRLGVVSNQYFIDFYGADASSFLHRNGTDRLWVTWPVGARRVTEKLEKPASMREYEQGESLVEVGENSIPREHDLDSAIPGDIAFIEIPAQIGEIERLSLELAADWREATRIAFNNAIGEGFVVIDFVRRSDIGRYVLSRSQTLDELAA